MDDLQKTSCHDLKMNETGLRRMFLNPWHTLTWIQVHFGSWGPIFIVKIQFSHTFHPQGTYHSWLRISLLSFRPLFFNFQAICCPNWDGGQKCCYDWMHCAPPGSDGPCAVKKQQKPVNLTFSEGFDLSKISLHPIDNADYVHWRCKSGLEIMNLCWIYMNK